VFHRPLRRPLAIVSLLALADYLLWNWSLGGSRDILALVAGLTLVPLLIAVAWLLVRDTTRLLAKTARRTRTRPTATRAGDARARAGRPRTGTLRTTVASRSTPEPRAVASTGAGEASTQTSPSSKLAA
jgi:hypothetical protein